MKGRLSKDASWSSPTSTSRDIDDPGLSGDRAAAQLETGRQRRRAGAQDLQEFRHGPEGRQGPAHPRRRSALRPWSSRSARQLKIPVLIHTAEPRQFFRAAGQVQRALARAEAVPGQRARPPAKYPPWEHLDGPSSTTCSASTRNTIFINAHLGWLGGEPGGAGPADGPVSQHVHRDRRGAGRTGPAAPFRARAGSSSTRTASCSARISGSPPSTSCYFRVLETADEYFAYYRKCHAFWKMYGLDLPDDVLKKLYYKNALRIIPGIDRSAFPQ